jgi:hypothetical protein
MIREIIIFCMLVFVHMCVCVCVYVLELGRKFII